MLSFVNGVATSNTEAAGGPLRTAPGRVRSHEDRTRPYEDLVGHLVRTTPLSPGEAARVIAEVLGYFSERAEDYVRRRHRELKARGLTNDQAFRRIGEELGQRLVTPPQFSARQLRRIVYG